MDRRDPELNVKRKHLHEEASGSTIGQLNIDSICAHEPTDARLCYRDNL